MMFWIKLSKILFLFIFISIVYCYEKNNEETIVIVGNSKYNLVKKSLISQLNVSSIKEPSIYKVFSIFTKWQIVNGKSSNNIFNSDNIEIISYYPLNITIITSWKGIDEMSLDEIAIFCQLIYQIDGGTGIIEIGSETKQLSAILTHTAFCWGKGYIKSDIINRIFFCNNFEYKNFQLLDNSKPIHNNYLKYQQPSTENIGSWGFNILGATYAHEIENDDKNQNNPTKKIINVDVEKLKIIRRHHYANKKKVRRHRHRKIVGNKVIIDMSKIQSTIKKYECKYRKSCYATGQLNLDIIYKDPIETEVLEKVPLTVDQLKLICKYRKSCYDSAGIPNDQKKLLEENDDDDKVGLITGGGKKVIKATKKNKKSLKNIASKTLKNAQKKVAVAVEKLEDNPNYIFEKYLDENEKLLKKKYECKFRKSCYETGIVPLETQPSEPLEVIIQRYWDWIENKFHFDIDFNIVKEEVPFNDLSSDDKKLRCHFRKSCYETGIKPNISNKIFETPVIIEEEVESIFGHSEENKKLACKYRKSCYETGIVPQISNVVPEVKEKVIPLDENDFKSYCKFRKSCYAKVAKLETDENQDTNTIEKDEIQIKNDIINEVKEMEDKEIKIENEEENKPEVQEEIKKKEKKQKKLKKNNIQDEVPVKVIPDQTEILNNKKDSIKGNVVEEKLPKGKKSKKSKKEQSTDKETNNVEVPKPKETSKKGKKEEVNKEESINIDISKSKDIPKKVKKNKIKKEEKIIEESDLKVDKENDIPKTVEEPKISKTNEEKISKETDKPTQSRKIKKEKQNFEPKISDKKDHSIEQKNWYENIYFDRYMNSVYDLAKFIQNVDYSSYFKSQETPIKEHHEHIFDPIEEGKKLKCRYRKSCYETGEIPNLTHHILEPPIVEIKEHHHIFDKENEDKKLSCKYRKSCYETGELPTIMLPTDIHEYKVELKTLENEDDLKMFCKYRKSCYGTKVPPNITEKKIETKEVYIPPDEYYMKMKCKYRKSCYQNNNDYEHKKEEEKKIDKQKDTKIQAKKSKKIKTDNNDKIKKSNEISKENIIIDMSNQSQSVSDDSIEILKTTDDKIIKIIQSQKEIKRGTDRPIKCNPFRISCKQLLGLPLSEKAPRAKNGRKLCRKKKIST